MAVVIETTLGDITVDLYLQQRPVSCLNFLKLCKMKYYNFNLFHTIRSGFIAQTGDPSGEGSGGESIFGLLEGPKKRFFSGEKMPKIRHTNAGLLSMVGTGDMMIGSQFFFTLAPDLDSLDNIHCVIGEVTEGHEVLRKLNEVICDETHRPYQDVRITHTVILEDPFNNPSGFRAPSRSPSPSAERLKGGRIAPDEDIDETQGKTAAEIQEMIEEKEAKARATILEIVGDLPDADIAPPENVLFVCKLNPVTTDEDLEIIFSRFGTIIGCEVIRDKKTGDSLQYAFIEFADKKSCEDAYFKMDNVLIDDRRIHVDFSQSVSKMRWLGKGKGVQNLSDKDTMDNHVNNKKKYASDQRHDNKEYSNHNHLERGSYRHSRTSNDKSKNVVNENDKRHRYENEKKVKRSRSRSIEKHRAKRDRSRSRNRYRSKSKDRSSKRNRSSDRANISKSTEKKENTNTKRSHKDKQENSKQTENKVMSPQRQNVEKHLNPNKCVKANKSNSINDKKHKNNHDTFQNEQQIRNDKSQETASSKNKRHLEQPIEESNSKRLKKEVKEHSDNQSQLPNVKKKKPVKPKKTVSTKRKKIVKNKKKKRKPSTSSSESDTSDTDTSSSSSESSSSSDSDDKRRRKKRRRNERDKKRSKKIKKKVVKKNRKK
ncbi:hypothetical protein ACJJTC_000549 [Scirpophaga incertulas]